MDTRNRLVLERQPAVDKFDNGTSYPASVPAETLVSGVRPEIETSYDFAGNVVEVEDARDQTTITDYDNTYRPTLVTSPSAHCTTDWDTDTRILKTPTVKTEYDQKRKCHAGGGLGRCDDPQRIQHHDQYLRRAQFAPHHQETLGATKCIRQLDNGNE